MGVAKEKRPELTPGLRFKMSIANVSSTATRLNAPGCYAIAAPAADITYQLGNPKRGAVALVYVDTSSTKVVTIQTKSSATTLFGSTANDVAISTGQACAALTFTGLSTSSWAWGIASKSTTVKATLAGSTR